MLSSRNLGTDRDSINGMFVGVVVYGTKLWRLPKMLNLHLHWSLYLNFELSFISRSSFASSKELISIS